MSEWVSFFCFSFHKEPFERDGSRKNKKDSKIKAC